jgi:hypothetical protein
MSYAKVDWCTFEGVMTGKSIDTREVFEALTYYNAELKLSQRAEKVRRRAPALRS